MPESLTHSQIATPSQELCDGWELLQSAGPEFDGYLSNHGPMVVEAMAHHGLAPRIDAWTADYRTRLDSPLGPGRPIPRAEWADALGDRRRLADWTALFLAEVDHHGWQQVLTTWWLRLLPGLAGGAAHPVIRVGHAVRALTDGTVPEDAGAREVAHALGYWAAAHLAPPSAGVALGPDVAASLAAVRPLAQRTGGLRQRLDALDAEGRPHPTALPAADDVPRLMQDMVTASVERYARVSGEAPIMLVHASTAPNAVRRILPVLPRELWPETALAAWSATATLHAVYAAPVADAPARAAEPARDPLGAFEAAVAHGDEHAIKLADTALDVASWTGDDAAVASIRSALAAIDPM